MLVWLQLINNTLNTPKVINLLKENVDGILVTKWLPASIPLGEQFSNNMYSIGITYDSIYNDKLCYLGENMSTFALNSDNTSTGKSQWDYYNMKDHINDFPHLLVDEADLEYLKEYKKYRCEVTFSNYRNYFRIKPWKWIANLIGHTDPQGYWRITIPFSSQIPVWDKLNTLFPVRFKKVWIHIKLNVNQFDKLIQWAKINHKQIMLYSGDLDITEDEFVNNFTKFIQILKQYQF